MSDSEPPEHPQALEGARVLLILVPHRATRTAYFVAGTAHWTGEALEVRPAPDAQAAVARGPAKSLRPFSPRVLPHLIVPEHAARIGTLARGATACVAVFVDEPPPVGVSLEAPFFGLMRGQHGELLLMQGDAEHVATPASVRHERRQLAAAVMMVALAGFYVLQIWRAGRQATPSQIDGSLWPYLGVMATAPAALVLLAAAAASRIAPDRAPTRLLQAVASHVAPIGLFAGLGLLLPSLL